MQNFLKKRVLPLVLAFSFVLSLVVVPANAASAVGGQIAAGKTGLTEALGDYPSFFEGVIAYIEKMEFGTGTSSYSPGVSLYSRISEPSFIFDVGSVENLYSFATAINLNDVGLKCLVSQTGTGVNDYYYIQYISVQKFSGAQMNDRTFTGALRMKYTAADENGMILVASVAAAGDVEGQWLPYNKTLPQDTISYESLEAMRLGMQSHGINCNLTKMDIGYVITRSSGTPPYYVTQAYCNPWGGMYVAVDDGRALTDNRNHIDGDGNKVNVGIDLDGGTLSLGDGSVLGLTQLIYDEAAKTYYIDARDYSSDDDTTYITYNYSWTFNIDYTSITYIGQTEEYNKYYEYYYELPDGRSSADLTPEELEQLNVSMDVLPYIRSADDTSIRALYHFDGDTRDSSYWSYAGELTWNKGASITFMDAATFNGALYLDENEHDFTVKLPSNMASYDFTIQFRYYQSHTPAPVTDSSITLGSLILASFDGQSIIFGGKSYPISVGNWQEICFMRSGNTLYCFHNGVLLGSVTAAGSYGDTLRFVFGNQQQTFKYFDELRVVTKAVYDTDGYTPTAVPFDTNLALVLPDSKLPVADAYWDINSSGNNILSSYGLDNWVNADYAAGGYIHGNHPYSASGQITKLAFETSMGWYWRTYAASSPSSYGGTPLANSYRNYCQFPRFNAWQSDLLSGGSGLVITNAFVDSYSASMQYPTGNANAYRNYMISGGPSYNGWMPYGGLFSVLGFEKAGYGGINLAATYTFSVVCASGYVESVTFCLNDLPTALNAPSYVMSETDNTVFGVARSGFNGGMITYYLFIAPKDVSNGASTDPIVYMELVEGDSTDLTAEYVESVVVMDKDDLNTPSLAVKTDLEITGHQIGGMRPSVPQKGLVWALVEGGVIKSLQIYNGSAWEAVDGRIWTGSRWVPYSAYNVLLLKDLYDISGTVSPDDYEYIYTEQGFWSWLQKWLNDFKAALFGKLDQIIDGAGSGTDSSDDPASDCEHAYAIDFQSDPTCTDPGKTVYSCPMCGDSYTEHKDALEHDWLEQSHVDDSYHLPVGTRCPNCFGTNFLPTLSGKEYSCTCSDCQTTWEVDARVETGYTLYECSRCGEQRKEYNDSDSNLFEAIGNFLADGVEWISDKLQQVVNSLSGITNIFTSMVETIKQYAGNYSGLFGEFLALMPADLMTVVWFGLVIMVVLMVWKKWFS